MSLRSLPVAPSKVRRKLGDGHHAAAIDLAARAKALFLEDPDDGNGKAREGIALLH